MIRVKLVGVITQNDSPLNQPTAPVKTPHTPPVERTPNPTNKLPTGPSSLFRRLEIIESDGDIGPSFRGGSQKRSGFKLAMWTWLSASIDALVLVSISCFFMIAFSFLMKISPTSLVVTFIKSQHVVFNLAALFLLSTWSYLIFMRAFIGASIGEWSCDLRLGEPVQRFKSNYVLKVMFRTTLVMLTGVFILPLLSLLFAKDIAGELSGLRIYSLQ